MNLAGKFLRLPLRLFIAGILLLMLPVVGIAPRAAAMDEHNMPSAHLSDPNFDCAAACARAAATPLQLVVLNEEEALTPSPEPQLIVPYYQQFQTLPAPKKLCSLTLNSTLPGRPPDIVKLSGHFLF